MVDCDKFKEDFSSFLDGELPNDQRVKLEDHLSNCPDCKETIRQIKIIKQSLNYLPLVSTSPDFEQRLRQQIFNQNQKSPFLPVQLQNWKLPAMGSAIVLATVGLFLVFNQNPDSGGSFQNSADNPFNTAAPKISGSSEGSNNTSNMPQAPDYESTTLIADSTKKEAPNIKKEEIQRVRGDAPAQ
jgi:predicted anti-sigma-YlaC factor YlaD